MSRTRGHSGPNDPHWTITRRLAGVLTDGFAMAAAVILSETP